jgi:hypothetical protein
MLNLASYIQIRSNNLGQPQKRRLRTEALNDFNRAQTQAIERAEELRTEYDLIQKSRTLSDTGKREEVAKVANRAIDRFAFVDVLLRREKENLASLRKANFGFLDLPEESELKQLKREWRAAELRAAYDGTNQAERDTAYFKALERGDLETVHAFLDAPGGSWITPEFQQRGADEYAKQHTPQAFAEMHDTAFLVEDLEALAEQTRQMLLWLGASPSSVEKALPVAA